MTSKDTVVLSYMGDYRDNTAQPHEEPSHSHTNRNETGCNGCSQSGMSVGKNPNRWSYPKTLIWD